MLIDTVQKLIKPPTKKNSFHGIPDILKMLVDKNRYYIINIKVINLKMIYLFTKFIKIIQHL